MSETTIASFILRFTREHDAGAPSSTGWRGVIRHVQTSEETHFMRIEGALAFIARYVDITNGGMDENGDIAKSEAKGESCV